MIALPLKFSPKLGAKQETQAVEKDLFDNVSSIKLKAEVATVIMVETTSLKEQIASLTAAVENLLKHVRARDDQPNKLHDKFQSTPALK
ncbi:UNVERIFIED_CONTAM: hypothetical protein Sradi_2103400 [Sesamum radiatum]|uniref:Uncharacterized protein n=1 Tax=Sesamum radiatum TaxID=300843 RepID=A0AAW2TLY1_SESRA